VKYRRKLKDFRWLYRNYPMKEFTLTRQKVEDLLAGLQAISRSHPQSSADGKTVTRDFEIPPKARFLLLENMTTLKEKSEEKERKRLHLVQSYLPKGEQAHTPEEVSVFQKAYLELMAEQVAVKIYQIYIYDEKTERTDAIDLTKAPIPFDRLVDLNRIILIRPETGNSDSSQAA